LPKLNQLKKETIMENLITKNAVVINKKDSVDALIEKYQSSVQSAIEHLLNMGESVYDAYRKSKSGEFSKDDLKYFCDSVGLDPNSCTFRKYKLIGQNASKFRQNIEKLPSTFSVLYQMSTLEPDEFERYVTKRTLPKNITLEQFKKLTNKSSVLTKNNLYNPPATAVSTRSMSKVLKKTNFINLHIIRDLEESEFNQVIDALTKFRNSGWISFDDPEITECLISESEVDADNEKYFIELDSKDVREIRV
jgi:hypothetical protein